MLKEDKLPFQHDDFFDATQGLARQGTVKGPSSQLQKLTDKFLSTLGQGFGAAANVSKGPNQSSMLDESKGVVSPREASRQTITGAGPNYFEFRAKELQEEID